MAYTATLSTPAFLYQNPVNIMTQNAYILHLTFFTASFQTEIEGQGNDVLKGVPIYATGNAYAR